MIGLNWKKCALHIHTPESFDYKGDKNINPEQFLEKLIENNVDIIAITDHSSFEYIDKIYNAKNDLDCSIIIFPGTEIHTKDGIHLIVLFERETDVDKMIHFLNNIDIEQEQFGTDNKCDKLLEGYEIINKLEELNALPIFAHVCSNKGLFKDFSGHEIKDEIIKQKKFIFECKKNKINEINTDEILPLIIKSDFHNETEFSNDDCYTWIKLDDDPNLLALRQIIYDPVVRLRYEVPLKKENCYIRKIQLNCHYFKDNSIIFNPELNTLIGGRGTGKSLIIEVISFILGRYPSLNYSIILEYTKKLNDIFNDGESFSMIFNGNDGNEYIISRVFQKFPELKEKTWSEDLKLYDQSNSLNLKRLVDNEEFSLDSSEWESFLNIDIYTQTSVISIGRNAESNLISTIDNFSYLSCNREEFLGKKKKYEENKLSIISLERDLINITDEIEDHEDINQQIDIMKNEINELEVKVSNPLLRKLGYLKDQNSKILNVLDVISKVEFHKFPKLPEIEFIPELSIELLNTFKERQDTINSELKNISDEYLDLKTKVRDFESFIRDEWQLEYKKQIKEIQDQDIDQTSSETEIHEISEKKKENLNNLEFKKKKMKKRGRNSQNYIKIERL